MRTPIRVEPMTDNPRLGQTIRFAVRMCTDGVEWRAFLKWKNLLYMKPLADWTTASECSLFPEAAGAYILRVQWRLGADPAGVGWVEHAFRIGEGSAEDIPHSVQVGDYAYWVPDGQSGVSMSKAECAVLRRMTELAAPGRVVYDIGANLGMYAVPLAHAVGRRGRVLCFEANPVCISYLHANIRTNGCSDRCDILPIALAAAECTVPFTLHYGNSTLGLSQESGFYAGKTGHVIHVEGHALDDLVEDGQVPPPDLVKLDVEGAEGAVLQGARRMLAAHRPTLMIEVHGAEAARQVLPILAPMNYACEELESGRKFPDTDGLVAWFPDRVLRVLFT